MPECFDNRGSERRPSVCIHTRKITDSCRDKDCIEDLRVYLTKTSQATLDNCAAAKARCAELIHAHIEVDPVAFNRNHYCVDITFYYKVLADTVTEGGRPATLYGLALFTKRVVLCGEDSCARTFSSKHHTFDSRGPMPTAVVEALDPMILDSKVVPVCDCAIRDLRPGQIPSCICQLFDEELVLTGEARRLFVTLGQFSMIRLEKDVQIQVPVEDFCIPCKECCDSAGCAEDPCEMFSRIAFPVEQFLPQSTSPEHCQNSGYGTTGNCQRKSGK